MIQYHMDIYYCHSSHVSQDLHNIYLKTHLTANMTYVWIIKLILLTHFLLIQDLPVSELLWRANKDVGKMMMEFVQSRNI